MLLGFSSSSVFFFVSNTKKKSILSEISCNYSFEPPKVKALLKGSFLWLGLQPHAGVVGHQNRKLH